MDRVFLRGRTILCRSVGLTTKFSGVGSRTAVSAHHPHFNLISIRQWSEASNTALKRKKKTNSNLRQGGASSGRIAVLEQGGKNGKMPKLCTGCGVEMISGGGGNNDKQMAAGHDATQSNTRSKKQEKKARYADIFDRESSSTRLCQRCKSLQNGNVMAAYDALKDVDAKVFSSQLAHIVSRRKFGLCIVVIDGTDPEFSSVRKLRDVIKSTPCILAINKSDLLPRISRYELNYLKQRAQSGRTRVIDAYAVSAQNGTGMVQLAEGIVSELAGKDVFVVGSANVGKSTLVKSLSSLLARTLRFRGKNKRVDDKRRGILKNLNTTQSHLPGTTLQAVRIPCFPSTKHALWDTPGIINKSAIQYSLFPSHLMEPLAYPNKIEIPTRENGKKVRVRKGYSLLIEAGWTNEEVVTSLDSDDIEDEDDWFKEGSKSSKTTYSNKPFTLARLDVIADGGHPVEALAFIPSCLTIRIVRTDSNTPTEATIPQDYIDKVQKLVGSSGNFDNNTTSRPLTIFKGGGGPEKADGVVKLTHDDLGKWIRNDIVFASLGWIMLNHRDEFSVKPWCVKDSLWSKRRSLYPNNLENLTDEQIVNSDFDYEEFEYDANMSDDDPNFERIKERLQVAAEHGRQGADRKGKARKEGSASVEEEGYYDDDGVDYW
jgi:hypothetical protein